MSQSAKCPPVDHWHCKHCGVVVSWDGRYWTLADGSTTCKDDNGWERLHEGTLSRAGHDK